MHCWRDLDNVSDVILQYVEHGVPLPLYKTPTPFEIDNYAMPDTHRHFITSEIEDLLGSGAIEKCSERPTCVSAIKCVPPGKAKFRLIIDLRALNIS